MNQIKIKDDYIKLNQLLKYEGFINTGGETKFFLEVNNVKHNGIEVTEIRKKFYVGDILQIGEEEYLIVGLK